MQAIEFEATGLSAQHKLPQTGPAGVPMRVLLLLEDTPPAPVSDVKTLLASLREGLTDEDFARPRNLGREPVKWDI